MSRSEATTVTKETGTIHFPIYFGHVMVIWKIENFCLRTCKENFFIHSQDFYIRGATPTKWKMILNPKTNDRRISISLQRLKLEPGPEAVTVNWKFALMKDKTMENYIVEEGNGVFEMDSSCAIDMHETENVYKELRPFDSDVMNLHCHLIVIHENTIGEVDMLPKDGMKTLSKDLMHLYGESSLYDIVLKTRDKCIRAHKAILHCRNFKFAEIIEREHEKRIIDLSQFKYESLDIIIYYIYTGDIRPFFIQPSIDLYKCVHFFAIPNVSLHYIPDEYFFHTTVDVQTISYLWSISNFFASNTFASPILKEDSNTTWQFHVFSYCRFDGVEWVRFGAEVIDGEKPQGICVELGVIDANENMLCFNRILKNEETGLSKFIFFVERYRHEIDPYIENGTLNVVVRIRTAPGTYSIYSGNSIENFISANKINNPYWLLSHSMLQLVESGKFSDVTLRTNDGTIKSHKFILSARSLFFSEQISKMKKEDNEINVNISYSTLNIMILYIYSGQIIVSDYTDYTFYPLVTIAANYLGIPSCKASASQALQKVISAQNASPILIYADKFRDIELKTSVINFIRQNLISVCEQETWIDLKKSHPSLTKEVALFVHGLK